MRKYGTPGASLENTSFSQNRQDSGKKGEKIVGRKIEQWAKNKKAHVFHSLKIPQKNFDIDHVIVYRGKILVVDAKNWAQNHQYKAVKIGGASDTPYVKVLRDGKDFSGGTTHTSWEAETLKKQLSTPLPVVPLVCVAKNKIAISSSLRIPYRVVSLDGLVKELDNFFDSPAYTWRIFSQKKAVRKMRKWISETNVAV